MANVSWIIILISILCISANTESDNSKLLPQSITQLKQYYDVINNLEQRGILNSDVASEEKHLYIKHASKLAGSKELLTEEEFLTWRQRQLIISFSNIIAILAGIIVMIALTILLGIFIIPFLIQIPTVVWEILFYLISIYFMIFTSYSWLIFIGCLSFVASVSFTIKFHYSNDKYAGLTASWICFIVWAIVAIYRQNREAGYLAIMALESALGFVMFVGQLIIMIGFQNEKVIPSATMASFVLLIFGCILHVQPHSNILTIPFTRPLLFLGTFVYFIGMLILSSRLYTEWRTKPYLFWVLQFVAFASGLATMFFGPMFEIPFIQAIGGTMFVIWLLEKYAELAPWNGVFTVIASLLGFGVLLYGFAYFLQKNPEYFIFHSYTSKEQ